MINAISPTDIKPPTILLIIFIVFVITDVIGATDIFPFIHPVK